MLRSLCSDHSDNKIITSVVSIFPSLNGYLHWESVWREYSNTLATWCEETHWNRPWCWERLRAGGEGDDRGWDGWMALPTQWTWFEWTPGVGDRQGGLACCGYEVAKSQTRLSDWTELNWREDVRGSFVLSVQIVYLCAEISSLMLITKTKMRKCG